jgi:hypothetical protein
MGWEDGEIVDLLYGLDDIDGLWGVVELKTIQERTSPNTSVHNWYNWGCPLFTLSFMGYFWFELTYFLAYAR